MNRDFALFLLAIFSGALGVWAGQTGSALAYVALGAAAFAAGVIAAKGPRATSAP